MGPRRGVCFLAKSGEAKRMGDGSKSIPRERGLQLVPIDGAKGTLRKLGGFQAKDKGVFHSRMNLLS